MPPKTREQSAEDTLNAVVAASFKLSEFYRHSPEVWFSFVGNQFLLRGIDDDQMKYASTRRSPPSSATSSSRRPPTTSTPPLSPGS